MNNDYNIADLIAGCATQVHHLTDRIQSFGILLRTDLSGKITHISENADLILESCTPAECLGRNLADILGEETADSLLNNGFKYAEIRIHDRRTETVTHKTENGILIEIYPDPGEIIHGSEIEHVMLKADEDDLGIDYFLKELTETAAQLTGFDRVTVYKFHDDWSGEVVAESGNDCLPSYSGLHFPASDIPEPVRNLYLKHPWRLIADIDSPPVKILSGSLPAALDLTMCDLRAAAPVHLEYLRNMGVKASFSVAIIIQNNLWGLLACHHSRPAKLSYYARRMVHNVTRGFAIRLLAIKAKSRMKLTDSIDHTMENLTRKLVTAGPESLKSDEIINSLKELVHADYVFLSSESGIQKFGAPFSDEDLLFLDQWFVSLDEDLLYTDQIHFLAPWLKLPASECSGLLAVRTPYKDDNGTMQWLRFYWIRREFIYHVHWAGEPVKEASIDSETGIPYLSPRRSFAEWKELKRGFSRPWSTSDLLTARKFRGSLLHWLRTR